MLVGNYGSCIHQVQSKTAGNADEGVPSENFSFGVGHSNYIYSIIQMHS